MLIAVIQASHYQDAVEQISAIADKTDGIELRFDYWESLDLEAIARLRRAFTLPMIFTLRKKTQGGLYSHDEPRRLKTLMNLCQLSPDYLDIEYDVDPAFLQTLHTLFPQIQLICSYHNFNETPKDLSRLFQSMQREIFSVYKIATYANSTLDALNMLNFLNQCEQKHVVTGICMGEEGVSTRILSPVVGSAMVYASVDIAHATAPGQLTIDELLTIYRIRSLSRSTQIYALLGDPITSSVGDIVHNQVMGFLNKDAVYIKLRVTQADLLQVIEQCYSLPFAGFSITMPLKESIVPFVREIEPDAVKIGAINTITVSRVDPKIWMGSNTDGVGAIDALGQFYYAGQKSHLFCATLLKNLQFLPQPSELAIGPSSQKVVILGAGGAARAIAFEARKREFQVVILNRTLNKAQQLAKELNCESYGLEHLLELKKSGYAVLINTLPEKIYTQDAFNTWMNPKNLLSNVVVMDIIYHPIKTLFLQKAEQLGCIGIPGYEMYVNQAVSQIQAWFHPNENQVKIIKNMIKSYFYTP